MHNSNQVTLTGRSTNLQFQPTMGLPHVYRVLVVEDDPQLGSMITDYLASNGFEASIEGRGDSAIDRIQKDQPDAVILDVNLPGADGFSVCRSVRPNYNGTIIILTARGSEVDEVLGLEFGADDYMTKPVRPRALLARLRVHLKRFDVEDTGNVGPLCVGDLTIDSSNRSVTLAGTILDLTTAEFDLLKLLAENAGKTLSRNEIYQAIHGMRYDGLDRSIDLRISRLRRKLGDDTAKPQRVLSVRGTGYQLAITT